MSRTSIPSPTTAPRLGPEVLSPAGDWECARAAVENGADAIYFGLDRFNARMRAHNFTVEDLPELMDWLHRRGVRGYVTFNTLVFPEELTAAEGYLRQIMVSGVDAAIVQDVGVCRLIRRLSPDFPIHASTQMTVTSAAGVEFARRLGCNLAVLARECSLDEIRRIQREQQEPRLPLEVFVHGALCVAYSGQCLTSEALGGRSANRGECAQACRMPYDLICDGNPVDLGDRRYLLSPQDLAGLPVVSDLIACGVRSLKIEGRLKAPEYVAAITRVYRNAVDRALGGHTEPHPGGEDRYVMEMAFSRGLYTGWFRGINNQELAHGRFGTKRGARVGRVVEILPREWAVVVEPEGEVKPGDGLVFDAGRHEDGEEGGRVFSVRNQGRRLVLTFGREAIRWGRVNPGDLLWKTNDPELDRRLRSTFSGEAVRFRRPIRLEVHGEVGSPLTVLAVDEEGHAARVASRVPIEPAKSQPLGADLLGRQLGRLGGTPFKLREITCHLGGPGLIPLSELNRMRRELVDRLQASRATSVRWTLRTDLPSPAETVPSPSAPETQPEIIAVIRLPSQLEPAWQAGCRTIYCEFENPKRYRETVDRFRVLCRETLRHGAETPAIFVAPPRIHKGGEEWILEQVRSCGADGWLVRNPDHLRFFAGQRCRGDFSLNVANALAAEFFLGPCGLEHITASYDLNVAQLQALLESTEAARVEVTLHQHMPMFHMEHCVFCAFLSEGKDYRDCGRPCEKHVVALRDRVGQAHLLRADAGCRNTVYNARAQSGAEFLPLLLKAGARSFRVEFLDETPEAVSLTLKRYRQVLDGELSGAELWRELKLLNQIGVTRGQLEGFGALTGNARQA